MRDGEHEECERGGVVNITTFYRCLNRSFFALFVSKLWGVWFRAYRNRDGNTPLFCLDTRFNDGYRDVIWSFSFFSHFSADANLFHKNGLKVKSKENLV